MPATWDEMKTHLSPRGLRELEGGAVDVPLVDPYAHPDLRLRIRPVDVAGAPWIELIARIGGPRTLSTAASLVSNSASVVGAFCLDGGEVALRQLLPLDVRLADLEWTIKVLGFRVMETRKQLGLSA